LWIEEVSLKVYIVQLIKTKSTSTLVSITLKRVEQVSTLEETLLLKELEKISLVLAILSYCIVEIKGFNIDY
jgi:hypothetical protein